MIQFKFNGEDVGSIDEYVISKHFNEDGKLLRIELEEMSLSLIEYKNDFPLIIDELKKQFNLCHTRYNLVSFENVKYLVYKYLNEIPFKEYKEYNNKNMKNVIENIRMIYVFNWLIVGTENSLGLEDKIYIRPFGLSSIEETKKSSIVCLITVDDRSYPYINPDKIKYDISNTIVKEWFEGSIELFYDYVGKVMDKIDISKFKNISSKIVKKYNKNYINWINVVYERVSNAKIYCKKEDEEYFFKTLNF